jgi:hypothetical protein
MNLPPLLLADFVDVIQVLLPIVIFVIWVISQALGSKAEAQPAGAPKPRPDEPEDRELRDEIEKFLRQAAEGQEKPPAEPELEDWPDSDEVLRQQQREQRRQQQQRERRRERQQRALERQRQQRQTSAAPRSTPPPQVVQAELIDEVVLAEPVGGEALIPGQEHLHASNFEDRLPHLGEEIHNLHAQAERRLRETFTHDLVSVDNYVSRDLGRDAMSDSAASNASSQSPFAQLLRDPSSIRQAVVLNEILRRPEERC